MSYTPTEWESTDVVTATRMNALEQAVGDMNMSYTPNTWSDGDILSAEKMNALEQAVASGGGGSSDFSTATVTVVESEIGSVSNPYTLSSIDEELGVIPIPVRARDESQNFIVPLYKGMASFAVSENVIVSGDATYDENQGLVHISGDCSIKGRLSY